MPDFYKKPAIQGLLVSLAVLFVISQVMLALQGRQTRRIQEESYITSAYQSYQADIRECVNLRASAANNDTDEDAPPQPSQQQIIDQCVNSVNDQRYADVLRNWGEDQLLEDPST